MGRLTAFCNHCGETCKQWLSAHGDRGWQCLWCGYRRDNQVSDIAARTDALYMDGTPVRWIGDGQPTTK